MARGRGSAALCLALGALLAVCLLVGAADAATHRVDWSFNADSWSRGKNFRAGDVLEFNYDPTLHNVVAVDAGDYYGCRSSGTAYGSGSDRITLGSGINYFICSLNGHCGMGMKMAVTAN
ncbi:Basic blue protein [Dichanthelium oligosanthes]|uniref:Plantacyanin n=1 Tax=Dichanthelium oligosanthes TaxID=888268 RepID=A0A1E5UT48_9POAL|nr:Basic blue protein [Dichanthelium oligosanthes]